MLSIWVISFTVWIPIVMVFGTYENSISLSYYPLYLNNLFNFFFWFVPLAGILLLSIRILWLLNLKSTRNLVLKNTIKGTKKNAVSDMTSLPRTSQTSKTKRKSKSFRKIFSLNPKVRFILIILIYWIQWIIPCVIILVQGLCNCISNDILFLVYWLTYTVVLTDPLTILILNPNVKFLCRK